MSRPCYDKGHRCPGWIGGGLTSPKVDRCPGIGYVSHTKGFVHAGDYSKWRTKYWFGKCNKCGVYTWPRFIRFIDPQYLWFELNYRFGRY